MPFKDFPEGQTQYLDENGNLVGEIEFSGTVDVTLTYYELRHIRYHFWNISKDDKIYTDNHLKFAKNMYEKFNNAINEINDKNREINDGRKIKD